MFTLERCIICLNKKNKLTREHVLPKFLGGRIKARILCKGCNNKFGNKLISRIKFLNGVPNCILYLNKKFNSKIYPSVLNRQSFVAENPITKEKIPAYYNKDRFHLREGYQIDKSLVLRIANAKNYLEKIGFSKNDLSRLLSVKNRKLDIGIMGNSRYKILNFSPQKFNLDKSKLCHLEDINIKRAFILIAYEWLSFFIYDHIFERYFNDIRKFIISRNEGIPEKVKYYAYYFNTQPQPFHLIFPEFQEDKTIINIRLFEYINVQVVFDNLRIENLSSTPYLEGLIEKKSYVAKTIEEGKANRWYLFN